MKNERIVGTYNGKKDGPLLICICAMHGNEPAGHQALKTVFQMLEEESTKNPSFVYSGNMVGLIGNIQALEKKTRFIEQDLNRMFTDENIYKVSNTSFDYLENEWKELRQLIDQVHDLKDQYRPSKIVVLDLHTTSSSGGIFTIVSDKSHSIEIGMQMHAPVVMGFLKEIKGTSMHYFNDINMKIDTTAITFESGQHDDPMSKDRAISAVINCMRAIGCVDPKDVESRHDNILIEYAKNLPNLVRLKSIFRIDNAFDFTMKPNYKNFQKLSAGEIIASYNHQNIAIEEDCRLLMPLYQKKGGEGFYLVKKVNSKHDR